MEPTMENFRDLAGKLREGDAHAWQRLERELHPGFVPIVRRALRTGRGNPALTRWLDRAMSSSKTSPHAPAAAEADPSAVLAWMLCNGLVRQLHPEPRQAFVSTAETIVDGGRPVRVPSH